MFGSGVLEVAGGMIFMYLLLALIVSTLNEWLTRLFALRASTLEDGLRHLLRERAEQHAQKESGRAVTTPGSGNQPAGGSAATSPAGQASFDFVEALYDHPLIAGLRPRVNRVKLLRRPVGRRTDETGGRELPGEHAPLAVPSGRPSYIPAKQFARALLHLAAPQTVGTRDLAQMREEIALIDNTQVRTALLLFVDEANGDFEALRAKTETWFNDAMDRVSGWYKRKVQLIILGIGIVLTLLLNADTLAVARALWEQPTLRQGVVASAQEFARRTPAATQVDFFNQAQGVEDNLDRLRSVSVPLGWAIGTATPSPQSLPSDPSAWLTKLLGLALTSVAVSLGAPFWFDLLSKVMNVRAAGAPADS